MRSSPDGPIRNTSANKPVEALPLTCSGCGAFTQTVDAQRLGHYNLQSKRVRSWLQRKEEEARATCTAEEGAQDEVRIADEGKVVVGHDGEQNDSQEVDKETELKMKMSSKLRSDELVSQVLKSSNLAPEVLAKYGLTPATMIARNEEQANVLSSDESIGPLVCERCNDLKHYNKPQVSATQEVPFPTLASLADTIAESPHEINHIYHVLDAADFPMSLIPRLHEVIQGAHLRSRNRRSKSDKFVGGRQTKMNFIITRSDLLAPREEMVDAMMPYLQQVLREALGEFGLSVRLGNLMCVSPKTAWWTSVLKEHIRKNQGASWLVGKANVGKSRLFREILPKRRKDDMVPAQPQVLAVKDDKLEMGELLPPVQPPKLWPEMPTVSPFSGTTVSPIRTEYGSGDEESRGELIDMPGLARSDLEKFVKDKYKRLLIWQKRIVPEQQSVEKNQSLLLAGGLIRISPRTPGLTFLMYNFTPLPEHRTSEEKAIEFQNQDRFFSDKDNWTIPGAGNKIQHAGTFKLTYDVTKKRAGPLTRKDAVGLKVDRLPFRVLSIDILIEGVGFVEIVAQVRARYCDQYPALDKKKWPVDLKQRTKMDIKNTCANWNKPLGWRKDDDKKSSRGWGANDDEASRDALAKASKARKSPKAKLTFDTKSMPRIDNGTIMTGGYFESMIHSSNDVEVALQPVAPSRQDAMPEAVTEAEFDPLTDWPAVDVYSPEGRFIGSRRPIQGWVNNKRPERNASNKARPRRSMKGHDKTLRREARGKAEE
ncbi:hypothetical protein CDD80_94 [Ophiocordyceps camponoti-rufipedis]|uniref:G domain-containing protein n=1 Tax=Ophiocordyceps camponoti-rufipedis TaxID=2004952 RepID=A0A2C5ZFD6_9HYPO|nr:hypothetical protein CDD80_94 [Ophiocordyceps camponoti-rufipedis]